MEIILAGIAGGLVVFFLMKIVPQRSIMKNAIKLFYSLKDYCLTSWGESYESFKDLAAESKAEYDMEKLREKEKGLNRK
jgi:hypothetical protein